MILYIQTAFLGDLLLSIPTLKKIKETFPDKSLHLVCRKGLGSFLKAEGFVDRAYDEFKGTKPTISEIKKLIGDQHYDFLICAHESFRSNMMSHAIQADTKIGYKRFWNGFIFDQRFRRHKTWPEVLRQMELVSNLNFPLSTGLASLKEQKAPFPEIPDWARMDLRPHEGVKTGNAKKIIALAPGSVWPTKRWRKYTELAGELLRNNYDVVLLGSKSEKKISAEIKAAHPAVKDLTGETTLPQMMAVLRDCDLLVCNDSGAMHMASLIGLPTVAIFGPTVLEFGYQPWNQKAVVLENNDLKCRPCSSHGTEKCPIGTHECMTSISVEQVVGEISKKLSG